MKKELRLILLMFIPLGMFAQNLVPNPGFENKISCPNDQDQLLYATPWYRPTGNTPDYFNRCSIVPQFNFLPGVPANYWGYQDAHNGDGYAGFASYNGGNGREYIAVPLLDTLRQGIRYCVSFYVSLSDSSYDGITPVSAYFSNTMVNDQSSGTYLPYTPQINSSIQNPLADTSNWTLISDSFTANGGEKYLTIGTFLPDSLLTIDTVIQPRPYSYVRFAYYYIDDVSVIPIASCIAGNDETICFQDSLQLGTQPNPDIVYGWQPLIGLSNANISNPRACPFTTTTYTLTQTQCNVTSFSNVTITVNHDCNSASNIVIPSTYYGNSQLQILGLESNSTVEIFDARGRQVYSAGDYQNDFWTYNLEAGIYFVRLIRPTQQVIYQKVCIIK
jgi:hypothetical protein